VPRINPDEYLDYSDEESLEVQDDEPTDRLGRKLNPRQIPREDRVWEENRRQLQQRRRARDAD